MSGFLKVPYLQIRPSMLLAYELYDQPPRKNPENKRNQIQLFKGKTAYSGLINFQSQKKLKAAINLLVAISKWKQAYWAKENLYFKFKVNFITLTLPSMQLGRTDKEIKSQCLDVWLKQAKRRWNLGAYVWRAERQHNGNLHFHLLTDTFIPFDELRDTWNDKLNRLGFIDEFEKKHNHRHPNSTDVHAVKKVRNLAAYVCKYAAKGHVTAKDLIAQPPFAKAKMKLKANKNAPRFKRLLSLDEQRIDGKVWDCSVNLKAKLKCESVLDGDWLASWNKAAEQFPEQVKHSDRCSMIFIQPSFLEACLIGSTREAWLNYLESVRSYDNTSLPKQTINHANQLQPVPARLEDTNSADDYCPF